MIEMGSCGRSAAIDDPSEKFVIEQQHLCSEVQEQVVSVQESCLEEEAYNVVDSNVELSTVTDGCLRGDRVSSEGRVDVTEGSGEGLGLASECKNADLLPLEKSTQDDCQNCLGVSCGSIEVLCVNSGSEGNFQDEGIFDQLSGSLTADDSQRRCAQQDEQKDNKSDVLPAAGDDSDVVEGKNDETGVLADAFSHALDFRDCEVSLESESMADLLVDCNQQSEQEKIMRNPDPLLNVVEKCDALIGEETDACRKISPTPAMEVPSGARQRNGSRYPLLPPPIFLSLHRQIYLFSFRIRISLSPPQHTHLQGYKMIGSFLTWALVMVFGYAYPAYECYKVVEKNKPEIEQLRFWCQYWILVAVLTVCERVGDTFISWVPMYSEAKLAFFIFLWYPKTKGTTYVYDSFFRPYVAKHETEIDRNLLELRTRAGDIAVLYWQRAFSYGQTRIYDILQFVAAQSTPAPRPAQPRPGVRGVRQQAPAKPAAAAEPQVEEPPSPTSSTSSSQLQREVEEELGSSPQVPKAPTSVTGLSNQKTPVAGVSTQKSAGASLSTQKSTGASLSTQKSNVAPETTNQSAPAEAEPKQIEAAPSSAKENGNSPPTSTKETLMEESIRVTRGRLRKTRSAGTR